MTETLEQLLLLARLDSSSKKNTITTLSLFTLIDDILLRHKLSITDRNLKIDFRCDMDADIPVPHYYSNIILDNIISNAIKYSNHKGGISIQLSKTDSDIVCIIKDNGIGIKKGDLELLFNHFFRSEALHHKHISGNGLGLSIAKKAAEAIQARIKVESEANIGTTFFISFLSES